MFLHTHNNHFKFGYGNKIYNDRPGNNLLIPENTFYAKFGKCKRKVFDFKTECIETVKLIYEESKINEKEIWICYSGGIDSEVIIKSFMLAKIPFKIAIMKLTEGLKTVNEYDLNNAKNFCSNNNLSFTIFELDIIHFYKNEAKEIAKISKSMSPVVLLQLKLLDLINSISPKSIIINGNYEPTYVIINFAECFIFKINKLPKYGIINGEWGTSLIKYAIKKELNLKMFFIYTPELIYAYIFNPIYEEIYNSHTYIDRPEVNKKKFLKYYFNVSDITKYTGIETLNINIYLKYINNSVIDNYSYNQSCLFDLNSFKNMLI